MTAQQKIEVIIEHLQRASSEMAMLEKTETFCQDWPELQEVKALTDESIEWLEEYKVKWKEDEK